jgi:hypothetical protein
MATRATTKQPPEQHSKSPMTNTLPVKAKVMIGMVAIASLGAVSLGIARWHAQAWPQLTVLLAAAVLSSRLKVKLPGMASSMSGNVPVILLGVTQLGLLASLLVAATAAISQSYSSSSGRNRGSKTKPVQFLFNACTLLNAAGLAHLTYHSELFGARPAAQTISLLIAAAMYFLANTAPIAGIISLAEGSNSLALWRKVFLWSFPNYVIGAGLTAIASAFGSASALLTVATLLVALFGVYQSYKMYVGRVEQDQSRAMVMAAGR